MPQFIEHEAKIVGPLTLKQFFYVGVAGAISLILYFKAAKPVFFIGTFVCVAISLFLSFLKVGGRPLPIYLKNSFSFLAKPKAYLWRKKDIVAGFRVLKEEPVKSNLIEEEKEIGGVSLKIAEKSRLKKIAKQIEMNIR